MTNPMTSDSEECKHVLHPSLKFDRGIWFGLCAKCKKDIPCNSLGEVIPPTKVAEEGSSTSDHANTETHSELAQEAQSEAPSVDSQIDEVFDWLLALYIDADDAYMVEEMEEDRPIFRAKINRLIAGAEENGILKGLYQARYATEPGSEEEQRIDNQIAELSNNLSKGKDNEG